MIALLAAALTAGSILTAPPGTWICSALDRNPSADGVRDVVLVMVGQGYDSDTGAETLVGEVVRTCPEHLPALQEFVEVYG